MIDLPPLLKLLFGFCITPLFILKLTQEIHNYCRDEVIYETWNKEIWKKYVLAHSIFGQQGPKRVKYWYSECGRQ